MAKYTTEFKLEIIKRIMNDGLSIREAAKERHVSKCEVQKWLAAYNTHGMAGIVRKHNSYTGEFKQQVVEDMRKNNLSFFETATKYNLGNHDIVAKWERTYLEEGPQGLYVDHRGRRKSSFGHPPKLDTKVQNDLIAENQRLRMENDYLKKLNALVRDRQLSEKKKKLK